MPTSPNSELIRAQIERLARSGSSDFQTLIRQTDGETKRLDYNFAQMLPIWAIENEPTVKEIDCEFGRGSGKTTIIADVVRRMKDDLPRGLVIWQAPTYKKFYTEIIPAFRHGLEMIGLFEGLHFFIGHRPTKSWKWEQPYKRPEDATHCIFFHNGFTIYLVSQDVPGSGRGINADAFLEDECLMNDIQKWEENIKPSLRGSNFKALGGRRFFDFRFRTSSTPLTKKGRWFIDREALQYQFPDRFRFLRATAKWNIIAGNLPPDYFETNRQSAIQKWVYEAEFLNIRPRAVQNGFYYLLDEDRHGYTQFNQAHYSSVGASVDSRGDADLNPSEPLHLGVDWGATINSMVVCQPSGRDFRALKNFYALGIDQEGQQAMLQKFIDYYRHHPTKHALLWYDATGNFKTGFTEFTRAEMAAEQLAAAGWTYEKKTVSRINFKLNDRFLLYEQLLREDLVNCPRLRFNRDNARELWLSMMGAQIKERNGEIKKDKSGERADIGGARVQATDLSDALDAVVWGLFGRLLGGKSSFLPTDNFGRNG